MSRSDKGEGHVLSAPAPTILLSARLRLIHQCDLFVGEPALGLPLQFLLRLREGEGALPYDLVFNTLIVIPQDCQRQPLRIIQHLFQKQGQYMLRRHSH